MLIYRVENNRGAGPFTGHSREDFETIGHNKNAAVWYDGPSPQGEALHEGLYTFMMDGRVCGVDSVTMLRTWFPTPNALALLGYMLTVWEVNPLDEDVETFLYQVVFDRERASLVDTLPISDTWDGVSVP